MSRVEDMAECPLCMEPFEIDDVSFFPCTCGYQICRFCWHRIRTNENGLCPACRKAYPEDPAEFKPLTDDEVHRIKKDRRLKESQRKQKASECRKHLTNIRVVQKNLVFVVGLSPRLCDAETLRRHEYFGKFGKMHKVVINQSTSYVGSQGPSASAYVTYFRPEDALAAIRTVNNLQIDGRTLKASLGTTKYCSHFLKNTQCLKPDCMYLHDYGDEAASFSKEDIQQGKHLVYEQKLHDQFGNLPTGPSLSPSSQPTPLLKEQSPPGSGQLSPVSSSSHPSPAADQLPPASDHQSTFLNHCSRSFDDNSVAHGMNISMQPPYAHVLPYIPSVIGGHGSGELSLFSEPAFALSRHAKPLLTSSETALGTPTMSGERQISDAGGLDVVSNGTASIPPTNGTHTDSTLSQDDDLGFDPWDVSARALADLIEKEKVSSYRPPPSPLHHPQQQSLPPPHFYHHHGFHSRLKMMPPGFSHNGFAPHLANVRHPMLIPTHMAAAMQQQQQPRSRMLGLMQSAAGQHTAVNGQVAPLPGSVPPTLRMPVHSSTHSLFQNSTDTPASPAQDTPINNAQCVQADDRFMWQDMQASLKAMLPNVNISFGSPAPGTRTPAAPLHHLSHANGFVSTAASPDKCWPPRPVSDLPWDPAIVNSGSLASTADGWGDEPTPHWMASLHHLTEDSGSNSGHMAVAAHSTDPVSSWMQSSGHVLPPGFAVSSSPAVARPNQSAAAEMPVLGDRQLSTA